MARKPTLKIWLDDERTPPDNSWTWYDSALVLIESLKVLNAQVLVISLDHDLGNDEAYGTGYDVILFIEEQVHTNPDFVCPILQVHSQNPVGRQNIMMGINAITKYILSKE